MERLSEESLEKLAIAILLLETESGLAVGLQPKDVLQPWILEMFPPPLGMDRQPPMKISSI